MSHGIRRLVIAAALVAAWIGFGVDGVRAADYVIGAEDVLQISFWQDPTLNAAVKVGLDGKISLDIVGQIEASGKSVNQLQNEIVRQISRLNKNISQTTVRISEYNYNHVFVIGQVNAPSKLAFEEVPDLWTIINEAGGITDLGDLSRVNIIRGGDQAGRVEVVDVAKAIANGQLDRLPKINRQDTIEVGRTPGQVMASEISQNTSKKNLIYVIGAVRLPGPVKFEENIDVLEAIALAGGPTADADLKKMRLVLKDGNFAQTVGINLEKYSKSGLPSRYIMNREDLIILPVRRDGILSGTFGDVLTLVGTLATTYVLVEGLSRN